MPKLRDQRKKRDDEWAEFFKRKGAPPEPESSTDAAAASEAGADNPRHKEDFTHLLNVAAKKREPKD